jgi:hypothetical protein
VDHKAHGFFFRGGGEAAGQSNHFRVLFAAIKNKENSMHTLTSAAKTGLNSISWETTEELLLEAHSDPAKQI